jgi:hypothetical protein
MSTDALMKTDQIESVASTRSWARSDVNGHFTMQARTGKYLLMAKVRIFDNTILWEVPITVGRGYTRINLSNNNATTL